MFDSVGNGALMGQSRTAPDSADTPSGKRIFFRSILTSADATAALEQLVRVREPLANYSRCYASASLSTRSSITSAASQGLFAWYLMID